MFTQLNLLLFCPDRQLDFLQL